MISCLRTGDMGFCRHICIAADAAAQAPVFARSRGKTITYLEVQNGSDHQQFGKIKVSLPIPHLLNLQIDSYRKFLQEGAETLNPEEGLEGVFRTVFPIEDFNRTASLEFVSYEISEPKYDQAECISKGLTYEAPVRIKVRLVVYDVDEASGSRTIRDIKEQDIYFGTLPLMTEKGTFIINGTERVIVNQLQRSPGIIFEHDGGKTHTSRKVLFSCRQG